MNEAGQPLTLHYVNFIVLQTNEQLPDEATRAARQLAN